MSSGITDLTELANLALTDLGNLSKDLITNLEHDTTEIAKKVRMIMPLSIRYVESTFRWRTLSTKKTVKYRSYLDYITLTIDDKDFILTGDANKNYHDTDGNTVNWNDTNKNYDVTTFDGQTATAEADEYGYPANGETTISTISIEQEPVNEANAGGYKFRCVLPEDFLEPYIDNETPCTLEGGYIYSDSPEFPYRYVRYEEDPTKWDSQMASVIRAKLALDLYVPADDDEASHSKYLQIYNGLTKPLMERMDSYNTNVPSKSYRKSGLYSTTRSGGYQWRR